jgi:hypothetical protein
VDRSHGFAVPDPSSDPDAHAKIASENELIVRLRNDALAQQEEEKLNYLLEHFGITFKDWRALSLALAREFVPGFQVLPDRICNGGEMFGDHKRTGRKTVWDVPRLVELFRAVRISRQRTEVQPETSWQASRANGNGAVPMVIVVAWAHGARRLKAGITTGGSG